MLGFYRDALGLDVNDIDPGPPSVPMVNWVSLRAGSFNIELFDAATSWDVNLLKDPNRDAVQLCFLVDDVEQQRRQLEQSGVRCDPIVGEEWGRYASFRDPEGNWLQLFEVSDRSG